MTFSRRRLTRVLGVGNGRLREGRGRWFKSTQAQHKFPFQFRSSTLWPTGGEIYLCLGSS